MPMKPPVFRPSHAPPPAERRTRYDRDRGSASARGYDRDWERLRDAHLTANPLCVVCEAAGRLTAASVVDHIQSIRDRPDLRLDPANLRSMCKPHHDSRTATEQRGTR